jgi:Ca2+-binding EF-hand superfamily protein
MGPAAVQMLTVLDKDATGEIEIRELIPVRFTQLETAQ